MTTPAGRSACGGAGFWQQRADVVVVGTGVAGLAAALSAHRRGARVVVLGKAGDTATFYAQGGIAVVVPRTDDSVEAHVADTLAAGGGLCDPAAVASIVADGYAAVADLVSDGARFDEDGRGRWALTREGVTPADGSCTRAVTPPGPRYNARWTAPRPCSTSVGTTWLSRSCTATAR